MLSMKLEFIEDQILFSTVRIEATSLSGTIKVGTGFIFSDDKKNNFIVTNKHIVKDSVKSNMSFHENNNNKPILEKHISLEVTNSDAQWFGHPSEKIDVAILPLKLVRKNSTTFCAVIPSKFIPSQEQINELFPIEDIIFIGYPNDIYDKKHLLPIVRKGITSTPILIDFDGNPIFLIDASVFPGSSGSPVFILNTEGYTTKESGKIVTHMGRRRLLFLGILSSAFQREDSAQVEITDSNIMATEFDDRLEGEVKIKQMVDLGVVYKSVTIKETIEGFLKSIKAT